MVETEGTDSSTEIESALAHTPRRMSDPEIETSSSEALTSESVQRQIRAVTDPVTHRCELVKELREAQMHRRHEQTTSSRPASTSAGSTSRSDMVTGSVNPAFAPLSTLAPPDQLNYPELPPHHRGFSPGGADERPAENTSLRMNQAVSAINSLPAIFQREVTQTKVLHTQVPNFAMVQR